MSPLPLTYSGAVSQARDAAKPIVALESTIITHGMPYPQNLETAQRVEAAVRENGAVPATIAVLKGQLCVGLDDTQLADLAQSKGVMKLSRADMALAMATGETGATTVAATMIGAHTAGIKVFATGGIGGVHQGAEESFDISADLQELAQTPVTVVSAGAKAILDLPKTLEVLETSGVPVISYGQKRLPAFWSRDSGIDAPLSLDSPAAIAKSAQMRAALGVPGGQLIANPVPHDFEISREEMTPIIARATKDAEKFGVRGKDVTPYLLQRIFELSDGKSLETNIALVLNNAALAAKIAVEFEKNHGN